MRARLVAASLTVLSALAASGFYVVSGAYDMGADSPHWDITRDAIAAFRDNSIAVRARDIVVPDLQDERMVSKGAGQYAAMCVDCHLAPGMQDSEIWPGLYPKPPNLSELRVDPKRAFWVVKHGLKMSAMPAWGLGHDDAEIWNIVAFVNRLPGLSEEHYREMIANAPPDEEMGGMKMDDRKGSAGGAGKPGEAPSGAGSPSGPGGGHQR